MSISSFISEESCQPYPGIDNIVTRLITRSIGKSRKESLGIGFMHKKGKTIDEENFCFKKYALIYVIRGSGEYVDLHGNRYALSAGSVFQRHPDVIHSTYIDPESNWAECFIDFGANLYNVLLAYKIIKDNHFVYNMIPDKSIETACYDLMIRLQNCNEEELGLLTAEMIAFLSKIIESNTTKKTGEMEKFISQSCVYFSKHVKQRIKLQSYCRSRGVGYECFRKAFRQQIGISPGQYIVNRRMDVACQMLRVSKTSISEIAFALGYSTQYEFSAQFKKFIGESPKQFRY